MPGPTCKDPKYDNDNDNNLVSEIRFFSGELTYLPLTLTVNHAKLHFIFAPTTPLRETESDG